MDWVVVVWDGKRKVRSRLKKGVPTRVVVVMGAWTGNASPRHRRIRRPAMHMHIRTRSQKTDLPGLDEGVVPDDGLLHHVVPPVELPHLFVVGLVLGRVCSFLGCCFESGCWGL